MCAFVCDTYVPSRSLVPQGAAGIAAVTAALAAVPMTVSVIPSAVTVSVVRRAAVAVAVAARAAVRPGTAERNKENGHAGDGDQK